MHVDVLYHLPSYDVLICRNCGLVYVNRSFASQKGEGNPEGFKAIYLPAEESFLLRFRRNLQQIEALTGANRGRLLDIGCGVGYFLMVAQQRGWSVAGVDLDKSAVDIARKHGLGVRWETVEDMPYADESFDVVTMFNVLEHLPVPKLALINIHRALKPGGLLVMETPTDDFALKYLAHLLYKVSRGSLNTPIRYLFSGTDVEWGHMYRFSRRTITNILEKTGFRVLKIQAGENPPFKLYLSKRNLGKKWLAKAFNYVVFGLAFTLVGVTGMDSRMVVYARKGGPPR